MLHSINQLGSREVPLKFLGGLLGAMVIENMVE